jgi:hypothetical protein
MVRSSAQDSDRNVPITDEDNENESFEIEDKLLVQVADTAQYPSMRIIRKGKVAGSRI